MRCLFLILSLALLFPGQTQAQDSQPTTAPTGDSSQITDPFLWEIQGPSGSVFLFGTIHLGVPATDLPPVVFQRLRESPIVMFEADIRTMNAFELMSAGMYQGDESLQQHFNEEQWSALVSAVSPNIPEAVLRTYRPWFLFTLVSQSLLPATEPMDLSLMSAAESNLSELRFFETASEQTALLASVPTQAMVDQIVEWVDDKELARSEARELVRSYRDRDAESVSAVVLDPEDRETWPGLYEQLIYERNARWVPVIEALIAEGSGFVAVGLGHLIGERSVVDLLVERGYTVTLAAGQNVAR